MKIIKKVKKGFTLIELLVVIAIMGSLGAVGYVAILAFSNAGDKQAAKENIKQIGTALTEFKKSYSYFPCDDTAESVAGKAESFGELTGDTSNPYFRQLFAKKDAVKEATFFAKIPGMREGDEKIANGECLKPGENAYAYVMQKAQEVEAPAKGKKNKAAAATPKRKSVTGGVLLFCCIDSNLTAPVTGDQLTFDMEAFKDYAIAYTVDGSTQDLDDESLTADEANESIGRLTEKSVSKLFGETRSGDSKAHQFEILPPAR